MEQYPVGAQYAVTEQYLPADEASTAPSETVSPEPVDPAVAEVQEPAEDARAAIPAQDPAPVSAATIPDVVVAPVEQYAVAPAVEQYAAAPAVEQYAVAPAVEQYPVDAQYFVAPVVPAAPYDAYEAPLPLQATPVAGAIESVTAGDIVAENQVVDYESGTVRASASSEAVAQAGGT